MAFAMFPIVAEMDIVRSVSFQNCFLQAFKLQARDIEASLLFAEEQTSKSRGGSAAAVASFARVAAATFLLDPDWCGAILTSVRRSPLHTLALCP